MWHTARHNSPNTTKKNSPHHDQENGGGCFNGAGAERRRGVVHVRAVVTGRVGRRVLRGGRGLEGRFRDRGGGLALSRCSY